MGNWDFEHGHGDQWDNWDMLEIVRSLKMVGPFTFGNILLLSNKVKSVYKPSSQTKRKIHIWLRWVLTREQWHWQGRAECLELVWNVFYKQTFAELNNGLSPMAGWGGALGMWYFYRWWCGKNRHRREVCIMCTLYIDIASTVFISSEANVYGAGVYHPRNSFISC